MRWRNSCAIHSRRDVAVNRVSPVQNPDRQRVPHLLESRHVRLRPQSSMIVTHNGILESIGGTPLVPLRKVVSPNSAQVLVKLEGANPTGNMKDRMAKAAIEAAERDGRLQPGGTVVEYTGGSTGASLALVCAA